MRRPPRPPRPRRLTTAMAAAILLPLTVQGATEAERGALIRLYEATGGGKGGWGDEVGGWPDGDPCGGEFEGEEEGGGWSGVICDGDGSVVEVELVGGGLEGTLPTEIGNLAALEVLSVAENMLTGTLPTEIGNLSALHEMNFFANRLEGAIPTEIGHLQSLEFLFLFENALTGTIPAEIWKLPELIELIFTENSLTGSIPTQIGDLEMLEIIGLTSNDLTGTIPTEFGNLQALTELALDDNELTGTIPTEIGALPALIYLTLEDNDLTGTVPMAILEKEDIELVADASLGGGTVADLPYHLIVEKFEEIASFNKVALVVVSRVMGAISFVCSASLLIHILRSQKRRSKTFERLICGLSAGDMITSFFGFFVNSWAAPNTLGGEYGFFSPYGAMGTTETCEAQGFLFQLGILITPLYNVMIGTFYLLTVTFHWKETRLKKVAWFFHLIPWTFGLGTAIAGLVLDLYNAPALGSVCWIEEYPPFCAMVDPTGNIVSHDNCVRGVNDNLYRWAFLYGFVVFAFLWLLFCMICVWTAVLAQERKLDKYKQEGEEVRRKHSRIIASQALFYVTAFAIPWVWGLAINLFPPPNSTSESNLEVEMYVRIFNAAVFPLQGLLNALVYVRPRYLRMRRKHKGLSTLQYLRSAITKSDTPELSDRRSV